MTPGVRPLVAGNWKMNGLRASLDEIRTVAERAPETVPAGVDILLCVPATLLYVATALAEESRLAIGAQDCHEAASGAHTGDISAPMIADCFATHVIVGHSERRTDHGETDALVSAKTRAAWDVGLTAIVCIGETEAEREAGRTLDVLATQLAGSIPDGATPESTVIAYEPVWAIGTGRTPTPDDVREAHAFMRARLTERFGPAGASMRILYGGSVKPQNAGELMAIDHVDGALVGGASLKSTDFLAICAAYGPLLG